MSKWNLGWEAVTAIGQCAIAAASIGTIYFTLKSTRPSLKLYRPKNSDDKFIAVLQNKGHIKAEIRYVGFRFPKKNGLGLKVSAESFLKDAKLPLLLEPFEYVEFEVPKGVNGNNLLDKHNGVYFSDIIYIQDSFGHVKYSNVSMLRRLKRFYWWNFGKYNNS